MNHAAVIFASDHSVACWVDSAEDCVSAHVLITKHCFVVVSDSAFRDLVHASLPIDGSVEETLAAVRTAVESAKNPDDTPVVGFLNVVAGGVVDGVPEIKAFGHPNFPIIRDFPLGLVEGDGALTAHFNYLRATVGSVIRSEQDAIDFVVLYGQMLGSLPVNMSRSGTVAVARHDEPPSFLGLDELKDSRMRNRERLRRFQQLVAVWPKWVRS